MSEAVGLIGLAGLALGAAAYAVSALVLRRMRRSGRGEPVEGFGPAVSIVKPLSGMDEGLEKNLESFFRLDYPRFEVVFSFASHEDPAFPVARRVADRHPERPATFVVDSREPGGNSKVNRLDAALRYARYRMILFSDGNVRVRPDFLRRAVSFFADEGVGLVSNLFRASGAASLGSRLEASYLNGCLLPGTALVSAVLRMPCVVGKSILVSRRALEGIGGMGSLRDYLAEDYLLGREVRRAGYRVVLSADVLDTTEIAKPVRSVWERHRRWAMMRRRLGGPLYAGELLTGALPWSAAALFSPSPAVRIAAAALVALRWGLELALARSWRDAALLPVRDLGALAVFAAGLAGRSVSWRGRPLRIGRETLILGA